MVSAKQQDYIGLKFIPRIISGIEEGLDSKEAENLRTYIKSLEPICGIDVYGSKVVRCAVSGEVGKCFLVDIYTRTET